MSYDEHLISMAGGDGDKTVRGLAAVVGDALGENNNGNLNKFIAEQVIAAGFGPVKEAKAEALEEAAAAWREYLPAVAGYGKVQPVPVWLERRAEWVKS